MRTIEYPHTVQEVAANRWEEITEARAYDLLGAVPPFRQAGSAFALGEALCTMDDGREVWLCVIEVSGRWYEKPVPADQFNPEQFTAEIIGKSRVDTLKHGQRFRCISGHTWTFDRKDHALSGAYWANNDDGRRDCFAGCAIVTLI